MRNYPIFYTVHAEFFENSDSKEKKLKKITEVFKNENPKKLRKKALRFASEIKSQLLLQNQPINGPWFKASEKITPNQNKAPFIDTVQYVDFFVPKDTYLQVSLCVSFGVKTQYSQYTYNKDLFPIYATGRSLHEIENGLKINLFLERQFYKNYNIRKTPKEHYIKNFVSPNLRDRYVLATLQSHHCIKIQKFCSQLDHTFFPTEQFYQVKVKEQKNNVPKKETISELINRVSKEKRKEKQAIYKKELKHLTEFYQKKGTLVLDLDEDFSDKFLLKEASINSHYFTTAQLKIHKEIRELCNGESSLRKAIQKWL